MVVLASHCLGSMITNTESSDYNCNSCGASAVSINDSAIENYFRVTLAELDCNA